MARIRSIKPEFWSSPGTAAASPMARLLFIAMWNWADDYGVGTANPKELEGFAFPNDAVADFPSLCTEVSDSFDVEFYAVNERPYYCIPTWDKHQRNERRSKGLHPRPDTVGPPPDLRLSDRSGTTVQTHEDSDSTHGDTGTGTGEQGNRGTGEEETCSPAPRSSATPRGFDAFWDEYPRRVGKQSAIKAWTKAVKHTTPAAILDGALRLAQDPNREDQFTPHPATWLNEGRWEDDPLPDRTQTPRTRPSTTDAGIAAIQAMKHPQRLEIA